MSFRQTSTLVDFLVPALAAVIFLGVGILILRSNRNRRSTWKFPVGWFSVVGAVLLGLGSVFLFGDYLDARNANEPLTAVPTTVSTTTTTNPIATTIPPSIYAIPFEVSTKTWAADALTYASEQGWYFNDASAEELRLAEFAESTCRSLTEPQWPQSPLDDLFKPGFLTRGDEVPTGPPLTSIQVEADMRQELGIERWESYGEEWYDSLVNGLCIRR